MLRLRTAVGRHLPAVALGLCALVVLGSASTTCAYQRPHKERRGDPSNYLRRYASSYDEYDGSLESYLRRHSAASEDDYFDEEDFHHYDVDDYAEDYENDSEGDTKAAPAPKPRNFKALNKPAPPPPPKKKVTKKPAPKVKLPKKRTPKPPPPPVEEEEPEADPEAGGDGSEAGVDDPEAGGGDLGTGEDDPEAGVEDPEAGGGDPGTGEDDPEAGGDDPAAGGEDPEAGGEDPAAGEEDPAGGEDPGEEDPEAEPPARAPAKKSPAAPKAGIAKKKKPFVPKAQKPLLTGSGGFSKGSKTNVDEVFKKQSQALADPKREQGENLKAKGPKAIKVKGGADELMSCEGTVPPAETNRPPVTWREWKQVMNNAQLTKGIIFGEKPINSDSDVVIFAKGYDEDCVPVDNGIAQLVQEGTSEVYTAHSLLASRYMQEGYLDIKTAASVPYVSASLEIKKSEDSLQADQTRKTYFHAVHLYPTARFNVKQLLTLGYLVVNPALVKLVEAAATGKTVKARADAVRKLQNEYGLIWANKVTVGGSLYQTEVAEFKNSLEESNHQEEIAASFTVSDGVSSVSGSVKTGTKSSDQKTSSSQIGSSTYTAKGGKAALNAAVGQWKLSTENFPYWHVISYENVLSILDLPGLEPYQEGLKKALKEAANRGNAAAQRPSFPIDASLAEDEVLYSDNRRFRLFLGGDSLIIAPEKDPTVPLWTLTKKGVKQLYLTPGGMLQYQDADGNKIDQEEQQEGVTEARLLNDGTFALMGSGGKVLSIIGHPEVLTTAGKLRPEILIYANQMNGPGRYAFGLVGRQLALLFSQDGVTNFKNIWEMGVDVGPKTAAMVTKTCQFIVGESPAAAVFDSAWYIASQDRVRPSCVLRVGQGEAMLLDGDTKIWSTKNPAGVAIKAINAGNSALTQMEDGRVIVQAYANQPNQHWRMWRTGDKDGRGVFVRNVFSGKYLHLCGNGCTVGVEKGESDQKYLKWWLEKHRFWLPFCYLGTVDDDNQRLYRRQNDLTTYTWLDVDEVRWQFSPAGQVGAAATDYNCDSGTLQNFGPVGR